MDKKILTDETVHAFRQHLIQEEKSAATIEKYLRDAKAFARRLHGESVTKENVLQYKQELAEAGYAVRSVNAMLASLNSLFTFLGWYELRVKTIRVQRQVFCSESKLLRKEEYERLCQTARAGKNERLYLILQTICGTGIRVSELKYINVESVRRGEAVVTCKGKTRSVFITYSLQKKLLRYIQKRRIPSGPVFLTRSGKPIDRVCIWRGMKSLCRQAGVSADKVFPHNLRHLFARAFYEVGKDLAKLADVLGHSSIDTTRIYIVSTGNEHRRHMENMHLIL